MAITAVTTLTNERICLNPSEARSVTGKFTADTAPGEWVVYIVATQTWTLVDISTAAHKGMWPGVAGYKKRVNQTTNALKIITDDWDISEAEDKRGIIWLDAIVVALCDDPGAAVGIRTCYEASTNAGSVLVWDTSNHDQVVVATLAADLGNGDTKGIFAIGGHMGRVWGAVN